MYKLMLGALISNKTHNEVISILTADKELNFLRVITAEDRQYGRNFSRETRNAVYLRVALAKELTCGICGARIHSNSITLDHIERREDGGDGAPENAQLAHPYCNHGYKEKQVHLAATI